MITSHCQLVTLLLVAETAEPALLESWRSQGWTVSWIGLDGNLAGILCAGDPLRSEAQEAVCDMKVRSFLPECY